MGINLKTFKRWKVRTVDKRKHSKREVKNKITPKEREEIKKVLTSKEYADLSPSQIVPKLADKGRYIASESTFYKILKEEKMLAHRGKSRPPQKNRPKPLIAKGPNQIYSWDITYLKGPVKGSFFYLYLFMDIFSRKIVGYRVHECESMEHASRLIEEICSKEKIDRDKLVLHSDNGGPMKGATMLATLHKLGVIPSFSRPKVSNDNPYSEALFKTLKYRPEYPEQAFKSIEHAIQWVKKFVKWYNETHLHSAIKFVTPESKHNMQDTVILAKRTEVYETAKLNNPLRWSRKVRNWNPIEKVYLNHLQKKKESNIKLAS